MRALYWSICRWIPRGRLAKSSLVVMVWQGWRLLMLAAWVVVAARALGPEGYGAFAGIVGLATFVAGFAGMGVGLLMYQQVAISRSEFSHRWFQTVIMTLASGFVLALLFVPFSQWAIGSTSISAVTLIAASEILLFPLVTASAFAFAAHDRMGWAAALPTISAGLRLVAIAWFLGTAPAGGLNHYLWYHLAASGAGSLVSIACVHRILRPGRVALSINRSDLIEGVSFASVWFTGNAMSSLDKSLVLRVGGSAMSGLYASAYRFASVVAMPVDAMVMSAMPRLFRAGAGDDAHPHLLAHLCLLATAYSAAVGSILWLGAGYLPWLLGEQFAGAVPALRWMCLFIPFYALRQVGGHLLVARGRKGSRAAIEICALIVMAVLAQALIPGYGLIGAVAMLLLTEALATILIWCAVVRTRGSNALV